MWSDDDLSSLETWYEAHSSYCRECGERWLREQMTDRLGALFCPDCITEQPTVSPVQVAGLEEAKRLRAQQSDINVALCSHELLQLRLQQAQVGR